MDGHDSRERVLVIAEPGCTHDGDLAAMQALIHVAAKAGADVFKAQWVSDPERLSDRRHAQEYVAAYRRIAFGRDWLPMLKECCDQEQIEFACSVYLPEDVEVIAPLVERFKVSSFEASDPELIGAVWSHMLATPHKYPILVSCGMGQWPPPGTEGLHCVSAYPAPIQELNLSRITRDRLAGFSDHSGQTITGALAMAAGARIVETHFRLDDCDPRNPDFPHSLTPAELTEYVRLIRVAEVAMGDGVSRCMPSEQPMERYRVR